tara:strand:- start:2805 stop:3122 length:318 start_codon:yes stop_codon:yes gene_type:complete
MKEEKKRELLAKHPQKRIHLEKLFTTLESFENENVWSSTFVEIEIALEEQDHHRLTMIENMLRRMHMMQQEEVEVPQKTKLWKWWLAIAVFTIFCFGLFYFFKQI